MFCVVLVLHFDPSAYNLNCLICHSGCTSTESLMKMRGMSNKRKTSFKRPDRKFLVDVTSEAACNWFGWRVLAEHSLNRKTVNPLRFSKLAAVLKWNSFRKPVLPQCFCKVSGVWVNSTSAPLLNLQFLIKLSMFIFFGSSICHRK